MSALGDNWQDEFGTRLVVRTGEIEAPFVVQVDVALKAKETVSARYLVDGDGASATEDNPVVTVALSAADAAAMQPGELPLGFMRGAVKVTGDPKAALVLMKAAAN